MNIYAKITTLILSSITIVIAVTACAKNYQDPNEFHAVPSADMALITKVPIEKLNQGHSIYKRQCSKCHEPKLPGAISSEKWHKVIPGMSVNAGLTKEETKQLNTYIISACRFIEREYEH